MNPLACFDCRCGAAYRETVLEHRVTRRDARQRDLVSCGNGGRGFSNAIEIESVARFEGIDGHSNVVGRVHVNDAMLFSRD